MLPDTIGYAGAAPAPILISPSADHVLQSSSVTFTWDAGQGTPEATSFQICITEVDKSCGQPGAQIYSSIPATTRSFTPPNGLPLRFQGKYLKWSVAACAPNSNLPKRGGGFSDSCTYALLRPLAWALPAPMLYGPSGNVSNFRPTFAWGDVAGADYYLVCISKPGVSCPLQATDTSDTLVVELRGNFYISYTPSTNEELIRFAGQTVHWTVAACNAPFGCVYQTQVEEITFPPLPTLSFIPSTLNVAVNSTQNVSIQIPTAAASDLNITLAPQNSNISIGGQAAGSSFTTTLPQGSNARTFTVQGDQPGNSIITASANGYQPGIMRVTVPQPSFSLRATPPNQTVVWGQSPSYQVSVQPRNNYTGMVDIAICSPPSGVQGPTTPLRVSPGQTATLTINTIEGGTMPNQPLTITIRGIDAASGRDPCSGISGPGPSTTPRDSVTVTVTVQRTQGNFVPTPVLVSGLYTCGNITAERVAAGQQAVEFKRAGQRIGQNVIPAVSWTISPRCRIGYVVHPFSQGTQSSTIGLYNLWFPSPPAADSAGAQSGIPLIPYPQIRAWFSPDDSLVVVEGPGMPTPQGNPTVLNLWDAFKGRHIPPFHGIPLTFQRLQLIGDQVQIIHQVNGRDAVFDSWTIS